jgi:hypothetical protein
MGYDTNASGSGSTAMGNGTIASGYSSTAMGWNTTAIGIGSTAIGLETTASAEASTAMGYGSTASGFYSTALGVNTNAVGSYSIAMGYGTTAWGNYATAYGRGTNASGYASTTFGQTTKAVGSFSTAMGRETTAYGDWSTAMGHSINASGHYSVGIGLDSTPYTIPQDNTMAIMGGNVGIGIVNPSAMLEVGGDIRAQRYVDSTNPAFFVDPGAPWSGEFSGDFGIGYGSASDDDDIGFDQGAEYLRWDDGADYFTLSNDLYLPNSLDVTGHVYLGDASTDNIVANGRFASSVLPSTTSTYDLGSGTLSWGVVYGGRFSDGDDPSYYLDANNPGTSLTVAGRVGIGNIGPQGALDIQSTTGGLIVPRMNTGQRDSLPPMDGTIIYNTDTNQFNFREAGAWVIK